MIWLQSGLLYLHILGAIFWFGSGLMVRFFIVPALLQLPFDAQMTWMTTLEGRYSRIIGPLAGVTVLLGILRGIATGVLGILDKPYGETWIASIVLAVVVMVVGARLIGPTAARMAKAANRDEMLVLGERIQRYGAIETGGMALLLVLMVAMHAGY